MASQSRHPHFGRSSRSTSRSLTVSSAAHPLADRHRAAKRRRHSPDGSTRGSEITYLLFRLIFLTGRQADLSYQSLREPWDGPAAFTDHVRYSATFAPFYGPARTLYVVILAERLHADGLRNAEIVANSPKPGIMILAWASRYWRAGARV
jgi:hypothetical protein